jgi:hypothetical protein
MKNIYTEYFLTPRFKEVEVLVLRRRTGSSYTTNN